jgi:hypothetical protein
MRAAISVLDWIPFTQDNRARFLLGWLSYVREYNAALEIPFVGACLQAIQDFHGASHQVSLVNKLLQLSDLV